MSNLNLPLTRASIISAHTLIAPHIHHTPVLTSKTLSALAGPSINLLFKCENLQKIGAFKIRGATHAIARLTDEELRNGVVTHSSGNHAQALALAARSAAATRGFPIPAYVVMPSVSTPSKIAATRGYGAEVIFCNASERQAVASEVQKRTGAVMVPPYDHPDIILGQGTLALEFQAQAEELGMPLDAIIAPCGGGGMLAGIAVACEGTGIRVYGAQPREGTGGVRAKDGGETVADGLRAPAGVRNREVILDKGMVGGVYEVGEEEIKEAMKLVVERMKVLIEPSSAVPVAAALWNEEFKKEWEERRAEKGGKVWNLGIVISGGNTSIEKIIELFGGKKE